MSWKSWIPWGSLVLVGGWLCCLALVCGLWLAFVLYFLESARRANVVRLSAHKIRVHELEARRFEKDFLIRDLASRAFCDEGRSVYLDRHAKELEELRSEAWAMERAGLGEKMRRLLELVDRYETGFRTLVATYRVRGSGSTGLTGKLAESVEGMRKAVETLGDIELQRRVWTVQEEVQGLLTWRVPSSSPVLEAALSSLQPEVLSGEGEMLSLLDHAAACKSALASLRDIEERIGANEDLGLQGEFRKAVHAIEPLIQEILDDATREADRADTTMLVCILTACIIIALLLGLAMFLAAATRVHNRRLLQANLQMEEEHRKLLQSERLAAIGQMVTGLAHESRNALQRTHACLDILGQVVSDRPSALDLVRRIEESQDYLHLLFEQVREYAAPLRFRRESLPLPAIVEAAWRHLEPERSGREASLEERQDGVDLVCHVDRFAVEQVFRNVIENSLAACEGPARIVVSYAAGTLGEKPAIEVRFADNGPGLGPEQRARIFEPFYTTKLKGTGLGMAISRRIVEEHGGAIRVGESGPGAEIIITLPREA